MAILTPSQLQINNAATYTTNGVGSITGATARSFNEDFISSSITVSQTGSMSVASASYAITASFALNAGGTTTFPFTGSAIISGSLKVTGSVNVSNTITTTNINVDTGLQVNNISDRSGGVINLYPTDQTILRTKTTAEGSLLVTGSLQVTGSAYGNVVAVTVASNTASIDLAAGNFFTATLSNSATTFFNFTNVRPGLTANLVLTTGTVSTASFSSNVKQPSGSAYLPTSGSGRIDALSVAAVDTSSLYLVASKFFI